MLILSAKIVLFFDICKFFGASLSEIVGIYRILSEIIGRAAQIQAKEEKKEKPPRGEAWREM